MGKSRADHETAEQHLKSIRRATCKQYSAEEKVRIVSGRAQRRAFHRGAVPQRRVHQAQRLLTIWEMSNRH